MAYKHLTNIVFLDKFINCVWGRTGWDLASLSHAHHIPTIKPKYVPCQLPKATINYCHPYIFSSKTIYNRTEQHIAESDVHYYLIWSKYFMINYILVLIRTVCQSFIRFLLPSKDFVLIAFWRTVSRCNCSWRFLSMSQLKKAFAIAYWKWHIKPRHRLSVRNKITIVHIFIVSMQN